MDKDALKSRHCCYIRDTIVVINKSDGRNTQHHELTKYQIAVQPFPTHATDVTYIYAKFPHARQLTDALLWTATSVRPRISSETWKWNSTSHLIYCSTDIANTNNHFLCVSATIFGEEDDITFLVNVFCRRTKSIMHEL